MTPADAKRREERAKLAATFSSNIGVGSAVAGGIVPAITGEFNPYVVAGALGLAAALHLVGQLALHYVVMGASEEVA